MTLRLNSNGRAVKVMSILPIVALIGCYPPGPGRSNSELNFSEEVSEKLNTELEKDPKVKEEACGRNQVTIGIFNGEKTAVVEWHKDVSAADQKTAHLSRGLNDESFTQSQWKNFYQFVRNHLRTSKECGVNTMFLAVFDGPSQNDSVIAEVVGGKLKVTPEQIPHGFFEEEVVDDYKKLVGLHGNGNVELDLTSDLPNLMAKFVEQYPKSWKSVDYTITLNMHGGNVDLDSTSVDILSRRATSKPIIMFDPNSKSRVKPSVLYAAAILRKKSILSLCKTLNEQTLDENHICKIINKPSYDFAPFNAWLSMSPTALKAILTGEITAGHIKEFSERINVNKRSVAELVAASRFGSTAGDGNGTAGDGNGTAGDGNGTAGDGNGTAGDGNGTAGDGNGTAGDGNGTAGDGNGTAGDGNGTAGDGNGSSGKEFMRIQYVNLPSKISPLTGATIEGRALASPSLDYSSPGLKFNLPLASSRSLVMINSCYQKPELVRAIFSPPEENVNIGVLYNDGPVYTWITNYEFISDLHFRTLSNVLTQVRGDDSFANTLKTSLARFAFSPMARVAADMVSRQNHGQQKSYLENFTSLMTAYANL